MIVDKHLNIRWRQLVYCPFNPKKVRIGPWNRKEKQKSSRITSASALPPWKRDRDMLLIDHGIFCVQERQAHALWIHNQPWTYFWSHCRWRGGCWIPDIRLCRHHSCVLVEVYFSAARSGTQCPRIVTDCPQNTITNTSLPNTKW